MQNKGDLNSFIMTKERDTEVQIQRERYRATERDIKINFKYTYIFHKVTQIKVQRQVNRGRYRDKGTEIQIQDIDEILIETL